MPKQTEVVRVRIESKHARAIRQLAKQEDRPFANMLNRIFTEYFEKLQPKEIQPNANKDL